MASRLAPIAAVMLFFAMALQRLQNSI